MYTTFSILTGGMVKWILRKIFPLKADYLSQGADYEALRNSFRWKWWGVEVSTFLLGLTTVWLFQQAQRSISEGLHHAFDAPFAILPTPALWVLASLGYGLLAGLWTWPLMARLWAGKAHRGLCRYHVLRQKMRLQPFLILVTLLLLPLSLCLSHAIHRDYSLFEENRLVEGQAFGPEEIRSYEQLTGIIEADYFISFRSDTTHSPTYILEFQDNSSWNSRNNGYRRFEENGPIIEFLKEKTGLSVQSKPYYRLQDL